MFEGMKVKRCGCVTYDVGDPIPCERHLKKLKRVAAKAAKQEAREERAQVRAAKAEKRAERKAIREAKQEKNELREIVAKEAFKQGHDLSRWKEYPSQDGKWTAHCHSCGGVVIVYDQIPERGDQVAGKAIFQPCNPDELIGALRSVDADAQA